MSKNIYINRKKGFIEDNKEKPCINCNKQTNRIDICLEARICSSKCASEVVNKIMEGMKND